MKKFFLFVAAVATALTVNAKVYDFSTITASDIETTATVTEEEKDGEKTGKLQILVPADQSLVDVVLFEDIRIRYNSDKEAKIIVDTKNGYFEFPGNGKTAEGKSLIIFETAVVGDDIIIEAANKSDSKATAIVAKDGADGEDVDMPMKNASTKEYTWVEATFKATNASATVSAPSCRVRKITIGAAQGINDVNASVKAEKRFENGQLVIIKNGVRYNALGAQL